MKTEILVQKLKNNDLEVIRIVYELFSKPIFKAAFFITDDAGLAEDIVHEVFVKLPKKIGQLEDPSKLGTWLRRIAVNLAWDVVRNRAKSTLFAETTGICSLEHSGSPEGIFLENEEKAIVRKAINLLPPEYKLVVYLYHFDDLSINEISQNLGIPAGTVKSRLIRARKELKKLLSPEQALESQKLTR